MVEAIGAAFLVFLFLAFFLGIGSWIFVAVVMVGFTALAVLKGMPVDRIGAIMKGTMWKTASTWELAAVPIFVVMGELIFRTDISERLFRGLAPWMSFIPGRLLHCNITGCTLFAAISGSSTATTATVGKQTTSALRDRDYNQSLSIGSLAGAGSLGLMIPPSITLIIYGVLAEESITDLFAAGIFPGLLIAGLYSLYIAVRCIANPALAATETQTYNAKDFLRSFVDLFPVLFLIFIVLGGIYSGVATPSEAAALGFAASLVLVCGMGQLTWKVVSESLLGATKVSCMVITILVAAAFMSSSMAYLHVPQEIANAIAILDLGPAGLIILLGVFYIILGMFLDGLSIMVMSLPITLPLIVSAGYDPVWFGIYLVVMIELGLITPPIGFNLFVIQGLTGDPIGTIAKAAFPFFLLMLLAGIIITMFPQIALWLPKVLFH